MDGERVGEDDDAIKARNSNSVPEEQNQDQEINKVNDREQELDKQLEEVSRCLKNLAPT